MAIDLEAVRNMLGYKQIDLIGGSYASVDAQAYVFRFPGRVHALILDSGFTIDVGGPRYANFFYLGWPTAVIEIATLECRRDATCTQLDRNPAATLIALIKRVRASPLRGRLTAAGASATPVVVDEDALANLFVITDPIEILRAAIALRRGDPQPLLQIVGTPPDNGRFTNFSTGMSQAAVCNDIDTPWDRADPIQVRRNKLAAATGALPSNAFAPFSKTSWMTVFVYGWCVVWPAPHRFEPVIPKGSSLPDLPTLILSGDVDGLVPTFLSRALLRLFPKASFLIVAGSGHTTTTGARSDCAAKIAAQFFDTLKPGDTSCAATP